MQPTYKALWITEEADGSFKRTIVEKSISDLPQNEVLIKVSYSGLNYKDALSANGHRGITRNFPHTPGIDAAGIVISDNSSQFNAGDEVLVTSYDLGMNTFGGFAEYIRVPASWIVKLPKGLDLFQAMVMGTAGFTAALALHKMEIAGQTPQMGAVLVTGATGAVGTMAVALLHKAGYEVIASTGKESEHSYLNLLGASTIISRDEVNDTSNKAFLKTRWAGAIDTVGGNTLTTILKCCGLNGNVAACGLVASDSFQSSIYPFIIKGNNLLGIESATCDMATRLAVWNKLANNWKFELPPSAVTVCDLDTLNTHYIPLILAGKNKGRVVLKLN